MSSVPSARKRVSGGGEALAGFFLSGFLLALLGAILAKWDNPFYAPDFGAAGSYFLSLAAGIIMASAIARRILERRGVAFLLVFSCVLSCISLVYLALVSPPSSPWWRVAGLLALGVGAGLLNMALFQTLSARFQADIAGTVNRGGIWYGIGCLAATLLVAGTFYVYTVPGILIFMAAVPALFGGLYLRSWYEAPPKGAHPALRQALDDVRSPGAVMFGLLLFIQFGNEWSIAGWLPLFLIRRVGLSPRTALGLLALYWLFLLAGRLVAVAILPRVRHIRLLFGSGAAAMFGCFLLFGTNNAFGAASGVLFVGAGYASIYPLVAEAIGRRFPYYHPGFFNGIFSFAQVGGLLAPASLGYAAVEHGVGVVIGIPLVGTILVMILLLLIWLESKVTGR
ncbi:MAG TPA: MFS transporter [Candidatus Sulfopaludibacter sp.]|nr:MFS transporter [Candidatus Sulfopaludibacter sp.]